MDNKTLIAEIKNAVTIHDYDSAVAKINDLGSDVVSLIAKVKNLEICYSKIAIVGGLLQDGFINDGEYDVIRTRIVSHLNREQEDFGLYLDTMTQ